MSNISIKQQDDEKTSILTGFKHYFSLNLKTVVNPSTFFLSVLLIPVMVTTAFSMILPIWYSFVFIIYTILIVVSATLFAELYYSHSNSTMKKNMSLTKYKRKVMLFSVFVTMIVINFLVVGIIIFTLFILEMLNIMMITFWFQSDNIDLYINWWQISWLAIFYYTFVFIVLFFSFSLFLQNFLLTKRTFLMFMMSFLVLTLFTSGTLSITWYYDWETLKPIAIESGEHATPFATNVDPLLKGQPMWWFGQFLPFYQLNQFVYNAMVPGISSNINIDKLDNITGEQWVTLFNNKDSIVYSLDSAQYIQLNAYNKNLSSPFNVIGATFFWQYYFFMPYAYIVLYLFLHNTTYNYKKRLK